MVTSDILVVDFVQQDDVLKLYPEAPLLSSDKAGWDGIQLQYHRHPPHHLAENYSRQHRIIIRDHSPSPPMVEEMIEHRFQKRQFGYGDVTVVPADVLNSAYWNTEYEFITLSFEARTFARHTFDLTTATDVELVPSFSKSDPLIYSRRLITAIPLFNNYKTVVLADREFCSVKLANGFTGQKVYFCLVSKKMHL